MIKFKRTDDTVEMKKIGRTIVEESPEKYSSATLNLIRDTIEQFYPSEDPSTKETMLYVSVYDYWSHGSLINEWCYLSFWGKTTEEKIAFVPAHEKLLYIYHLNRRSDAYQLDDKYEAFTRLKKYYHRDVIVLHNSDDFDVFSSFVDKHSSFIVKPTDSGYSKGVFRQDLQDLSEETKKQVFNDILKGGEQFNSGKTSRSGSLVIEEVLNQADEMAIIHPNSVNVVRVTTIRIADKVHIFYPWLKVGVHGEAITGGINSSILAGINPDTGVVDTLGITNCLDKYEYHPLTNIKIPGFQIPMWDELKTLSVDLAMQFPSIGYIGWDFALSPSGWCVIEGNVSGQLLGQLLYGKGIKSELEALLNWKPDKDFWWE